MQRVGGGIGPKMLESMRQSQQAMQRSRCVLDHHYDSYREIEKGKGEGVGLCNSYILLSNSL